MSTINLRSRYGDVYKLVKIGVVLFKWDSPTKFMRYISGANDPFAKIIAIDPSGGPYIQLGDILVADDNTFWTVKKISSKDNELLVFCKQKIVKRRPKNAIN
jgi:hypothetical protein